MIYLLDTDTIIFLVRGLKSPQKVAAHVKGKRLAEKCEAEQRSGHTIALSAITMSELEFGARNSPDYEAEIAALNKFLSPFEVLDYDGVACSHHYGAIRYAVERSGTPIGALDMLIAAHGLALDATVVTNNTSRFHRVPGLRVVNWC